MTRFTMDNGVNPKKVDKVRWLGEAENNTVELEKIMKEKGMECTLGEDRFTMVNGVNLKGMGKERWLFQIVLIILEVGLMVKEMDKECTHMLVEDRSHVNI